MQHEFDVVVVGGGMVGATLACALGDTRLRVAVIESSPPDIAWPSPHYDIRVSAITRATQHVFEGVGAWAEMVRRRVQPYAEMHVWDARGSGSIHFSAAEIGEPDLGHIVENRVILGALIGRLEEFDNVEYLCPARVRSFRRLPHRALIELEDGRRLSARLVVGSDGARSWVREQAGIAVTGWSYDQTAVVATVRTSRHHRETAWQRFLPEGPLAFLPLPEGLSSIVWSVTPDHAELLLKLPPEPFLAELQRAFGDSLGEMVEVGPRGGFPLMLQHAHRYVADRIALVGNAAHTIHPLAGQGLNIGVSDAAALAEVLLEAGQGEDIGALPLLRRYERWRKADNLSVMAAMDGFKRLFSNDAAPLAWARNLGLRLADAATPLKNMMVKRAMGLGGDLPALARGARAPLG